MKSTSKKSRSELVKDLGALFWGCRSERLQITLTVGPLLPFLSVKQLPSENPV